MSTLNFLAAAIGYGVMALALAGAVGLGDFVLKFGPKGMAAEHIGAGGPLNHTCVADAESFWAARKYLCTRAEYEAQQRASRAPR